MNDECPSESDEWTTASHGQTAVLVATTIVGIYLCYLMATPFLSPLAWAVALTILFAPLQWWLESKLKQPSLAALASVLVVALVVVVPIIFVGQQLVQKAAKGAAIINSNIESGDWHRALQAQPRLAPTLTWVEQQMHLSSAVSSIADGLTTAAGSIVKGSVVQGLSFCLTFYLLFFLLRDRRLVLHSLRSLSPLSRTEMTHFLTRVGETVHATLYGTLAVSIVQGVLGGLMFWQLGLSAPLLWGVVMALLAVMPVLGAFVVWIPAALWLVIDGHWGKAIILTLWGMLVVGTIDNLLRPVLVGQRLKLHTVLAFISVVGGIFVFGAAGLILGPVVLTITAELLSVWHRRTMAGVKTP